MEESKIIFILGPTGVGKTEIAVRIAERLGGAVISLDSRQIYRGMDIGTDKPGRNILERAPHYLFDVAGPGEYYSAGKFAAMAKDAIEQTLSLGLRPVVAGGAGLYLRALIDGLFHEKCKDMAVKERLRREADESGTDLLYRRLQDVDPEMAGRLLPGDTQRIVRALEVCEVTGRSLSEHWKDTGGGLDRPFVLFALNRPRKELYERIERRVDRMLERGLLREVEALRAAGFERSFNSQKSVGYREAHQHLDGEISFDEMVRLIKQHTRNYAKRQLTWFRKDERVHWIELREGRDNPDETAKYIIKRS